MVSRHIFLADKLPNTSSEGRRQLMARIPHLMEDAVLISYCLGKRFSRLGTLNRVDIFIKGTKQHQ